MSFEPPEGILDIGNATLRVGKLEVAETSGLNQGLLNIVKNNLLINENIEYPSSNTWGIKLPTTWVAEFDVKGHSTTKYVEFNFYNEDKTSNALGYLLNFKDTTLSLMYDTSLSEDQNILATATIPTIVDTYRKVNIFFERGVISVSIDGTQYLYHKETDGYNQGLGVASRVVSATGGAFVNLFIEENAANSKFKNLRIVNGRFISDKTSNIAFMGGNLGVGVNSPKEALDIRGNMHLTRVSNVSQIKVDSNVVTEYTGPHDRPLRKYPEVAMTQNDESATSGYVASASSTINDTGDAYPSFAGDGGTTSWTSQNNLFDTNDPYTALNAASLFDGQRGEWIQLQLPNAIKVSYFKIIPRSTAGGTNAAPEDQTKRGSLYGSNDGTNFTKLVDYGDLDYGGATGQNVQIIHVNATEHYKYLRLLCTARYGNFNNQQWVGVGELEYYGHEEGSGSLDTTLKSVYNVPATTGTQLEVYYDAKDLADMPSTVTDLAGGDQTGTPGTGVSFDSTYKAFVFDGSTNGKITGTHGLGTGTGIQYSMSLWFKADVLSGNHRLVTFGTQGTQYQSSTLLIYQNDIHLDHWLSEMKTTSDILVPNVWYHLVAIHTGPGTEDVSQNALYLNGVKLEDVTTGGSAANGTFNLQGTGLTIGADSAGTNPFTGSIANFRLYSKALNADQVKELYDYQKDYFLGSKSQVTLYKGHLGVGVTEPSGQLELAGDERIQEYPPGPMDDYDTHIPGHGVFKVYASTENNTGRVAWMAFNDESGETSSGSSGYWRSEYVGGTGGPYNSSTGAYISNARLGSNTALGEYVVLQLPYKIQLRSLRMSPWYRPVSDDFDVAEFPKNFTIYGSNDGNNWYSVFVSPSQTLTAASGSGATTEATSYSITSDECYKYFGLVVTENNSGNYSVAGHGTAIGNLQFFGTPGPTTLDKGSLTLGRSLDVPRVSRYDVDTETPRPEKLVVDFDTTVNSSPTDISGQGNHGVFNGTNMNYSSADKAFVFNGTDDYIQTDTGFSGNQSHTVSLWVKPDVVEADFHTMSFISSTTGTYARAFFYYHSTIGTVIDFNNKYVLSSTLPVVGEWMHLLYTYSSNGDTKLYMDGLLKTDIIESNPSSTITLNGTTKIGAGIATDGSPIRFLDGQISNFKIYNVALEPSEVKKLYNLGRTGRSMVISDTAVGIGKVPEAQLDVRGAIRGVNMTTCPVYFDVSWSGTQATNTNILFNVFHVRHGGAFAEGQSREFYAPITGHYYFSFYGMGTFISGNNQTWVTLRRNGSDANLPNHVTSQRIYDNYNSNGDAAQQHRQISGAAMIAMNAGDYMQLHVEGGNAIHGYYGRFQGFFLSPY